MIKYDLQLDFNVFLSEILGAEARWFRVEGVNVKPERTTLQHGYGLKWSEFLKNYVSSAFEIVSRSKLVVVSDYVSVQSPKN